MSDHREKVAGLIQEISQLSNCSLSDMKITIKEKLCLILNGMKGSAAKMEILRLQGKIIGAESKSEIMDCLSSMAFIGG